MKNIFYRHKVLIFCILLQVLFVLFSHCSIPFIGGKSKDVGISIFDDKQYLNINEYSFREYQWNRDSRTAEEIYIKGLDHFFKQNYEKALTIFNSALKFYKKDARIYTRLAESYARMNDLNKAVAVLNDCSNELYGYDSLPIINIQFEDSVGLDRGYYQIDGCDQSWTELWSDNSGTSFNSYFQIPDNLHGSHSIHFKVMDDVGNINTDTCDYSWLWTYIFICGDANSDQAVNVSDAVYIINYVFGLCV